MPSIQTGAPAPDFELTAHTGQTVRLSAYRGQQAVVLYFYPKDDTPGCTREACAFRDAYEDFTDAGAAVIGVSSDGEDSHRAFAQRHGLPFLLVTDEGGRLRKAYGVPKTLGFMDGRVTYVIDRDGMVRHVFDSQLFPQKHIDEALAVIRGLGQG